MIVTAQLFYCLPFMRQYLPEYITKPNPPEPFHPLNRGFMRQFRPIISHNYSIIFKIQIVTAVSIDPSICHVSIILKIPF